MPIKSQLAAKVDNPPPEMRQRLRAVQQFTPKRDDVTPETPLRLHVAAIIAFPDRSMTASGLRRESKRGRLAIERIAGKDYTTLADINRMRNLCRVEAKDRTSGCAPHAAIKMERSSAHQLGSSLMPVGISPRDAFLAKIEKRKAA